LCFDFLFYRLPDTEEEQPEMYGRDKGAVGIHGYFFGYKFCALVFLRIKNLGYKFKLASNVRELGAFRDVFVDYLDDNSRKKQIFVQLTHQLNHKVTMQQLLAEDGVFSLRKYYDSYIQIEEKLNSSEEGVKLEGSIDESLFIIYTNADVAEGLKSKKVTDISEEKFLMTGGTVLQFNEEEHKAIYKHLQELPKHREFLSRFRIFYSQADEKEMDCHIKRELQQSMNLHEIKLEIAYSFFRDFIMDWWQNSNCCLKDANSRENDPLRKASEMLEFVRDRNRGTPQVRQRYFY
jgi:hypothetical protein